ncbi:methionine ABC transporter ATP-binding protein [Pseudoxanthomonas composti]|uniref:Cell division ATP-binding protein FtsE n=1 Tax=Pseudoxanthomonas composti TaxID=2137479 RepID=A0A4Q1JXG8_9GAMM|nr:methionine ABC transporter ATP-binding protein [Pseudoxanthomonas composti]RXR07381.1 methionine ABC transporter ATP-binding protein [Pseudoxanthomonas composti]
MIRLQQVRKDYPVAGGHTVAALHPLDLEIQDGEVFGIIGHSGAGKSTLIRLLNGLEAPSGGQVLIQGQDVGRLDGEGLRALRRRVGMIFQHFNLLSSLTIFDNVAFPLRLAGEPASRIAQRVPELLARVGLQDHARKYPAQLSGGQKQRVGIARALATDPMLLLCDEATSALDPQTTASVLDLLADINAELGLTIVLITHEMDVVRRICDRVAVLDAGRVVEQGAVAQVFLHPQHPTTRRFVREADPAHGQGEVSIEAGNALRLRLTFTGDTTYQPILAAVARQTGSDFSILSGRIDRIRHTPYGQLTVAFTGQVESVRAALEHAGVDVEVLA